MDKRILNFFTRPFFKHLSFFIFSFILICLLEIYIELFNPYDTFPILRAGLMGCRGIVDSYILTFILTYLSERYKKLYLSIILIVLSFFFIIDVFSAVNFKRVFDEDVAAIILNTNPTEIKEFFMVYTSAKTLMVYMAFILLSICLYRISKKKSFMRKGLSNFLLGITVMAFLLNCFKPRIVYLEESKVKFLGTVTEKLYVLTLKLQDPDLKDYLKHPTIEYSSKQPQNIIMIIGESFAKTHSSLYGYEKKTNPRLEKLQTDSSLIIFNNVKSDAAFTADAFKTIMSTYRTADLNKSQWYTHLTLPEIIKYSHYHSTWISNQSYKGLFDNIPTRYAELCDSLIFVGNKFSGMRKKDFDEEVIAPLREMPKDSLSFFIVHLTGSHPAFNERYPENFSRFSENDYQEFIPSQRYNLATYDNSVLYNDSVIYEIMKLFKDKESIVFYFPDHALDIYDSAADFCSHANPNDPISYDAGTNIPFMVYLSAAYKKAFPDIVMKLKKNVNTPYCTGDILYTIMDVMGVKFKQNEDVRTYSLLKE